jgi:hypothetical protein
MYAYISTVHPTRSEASLEGWWRGPIRNEEDKKQDYINHEMHPVAKVDMVGGQGWTLVQLDATGLSIK